MKKLLVVLMAMAMLLTGCASVNSFLCSPTPAQTEAANVGLALAQAALAAASVYAGGGEIVSALATQAIPVFRKVVAGYCATQADWNTAVEAVAQAQPATKAMVINPQIQILRDTKW